jgi:hypothetical protein
VAVAMAREKVAARFMRPKTIAWKGLYMGILRRVDRGLLQLTLPQVQA